MKPNPLVTVLMPVYNAGDYLRLSIESILAQTFKDFEFLIINDCSTDNSVETILSFIDPRIVLHSNAHNLGQTKSLNIGLKLAKGKYVARMDADDMAFPSWLEKLINYIEKNPDIAAVGTAAIVIDSLGRVKEFRRMPTTFSEITFRIFYAPPMNHVSVLFNKALILKNGGYDEEFIVTQDYELWSSLIRNNNQLSNISNILVAYRVHPQSIGFLEANKQGFREKSETMFRNISFLTNLKLTRQDVEELCKLFYSVADLKYEEFQQAQSNFENIYFYLKDKFRLPPQIIKKGIKTQMLKPYCKLSIYTLQNKSLKEARNIALMYCKRYGFHILPVLIFLLTFTGYRISQKMPFFYGKWSEIISKLLLKIKFL
jgi:glycosyltransferase involved in cell wall biosynthesis